jgi:hypothetical protein
MTLAGGFAGVNGGYSVSLVMAAGQARKEPIPEHILYEIRSAAQNLRNTHRGMDRDGSERATD